MNGIFGKVLRIATEDTVLHLILTKCIPILLYSLDVCPVSVADNRSFDFMQSRLLKKVFKTGSIDVINECCEMFNIRSVSSLILNRKQNFLT